MLHKFKYLPLLLILLLSACAPNPETPTAPTQVNIDPTPTATEMAGGSNVAQTTSASRCAGLEGKLELQLLVGPAEEVGLEPFAVGEIPFSVVSNEEPYLVEGAGPIAYENVLEEVWGSYTVVFDADLAATGECSGAGGAEQLTMVVEMTGEQNIVVQAEGFQGEYPWSGTQTLDVTFPLVEGAQATGEGWILVLHLSE